jgi:hypothetical protein
MVNKAQTKGCSVHREAACVGRQAPRWGVRYWDNASWNDRAVLSMSRFSPMVCVTTPILSRNGSFSCATWAGRSAQTPPQLRQNIIESHWWQKP